VPPVNVADRPPVEPVRRTGNLSKEGPVTDYQRIFVDNLIEDINTIAPLTDNQFQAIQEKIESRIVTYDQERKDQILRDMPTAIERAMGDVL
jgi:hypothetical protein